MKLLAASYIGNNHNEILVMKEHQVSPKPKAEKEIQVPTYVDLIQLEACVVDIIQFVGGSLLDEEKILVERKVLVGVDIVKKLSLMHISIYYSSTLHST